MKQSHFLAQNPFVNVANLFDSMFDNTVAKDFQGWSPNASMNIKETETAYEVEVAAPGMKKENFQLEVENQVLKILGKVEDKTEETTDKYTRKEFHVKSFERTLRLNNKVDTEAISAAYNDGILTVRLPKITNEKTSKTIVIE